MNSLGDAAILVGENYRKNTTPFESREKIGGRKSREMAMEQSSSDSNSGAEQLGCRIQVRLRRWIFQDQRRGTIAAGILSIDFV